MGIILIIIGNVTVGLAMSMEDSSMQFLYAIGLVLILIGIFAIIATMGYMDFGKRSTYNWKSD